jgi:polyisoprenoid-binding protein YceI
MQTFHCTVIRTIIRTAAIALGATIAAQAAETYKLDPAHTSVGFDIAHLVISEVHGRFNDVAGEVVLDGDKLVSAKAIIQVKSIDTGIAKRDDHLRSPDFFDAEKYPTITFESTKVENDRLTGKLTLHGVTREITLPVTVKGPVQDPWGNQRIAVSTETKLNRTDYGMKPFPGVGDEVKIKIVAEATRPKEKN